MVATKPFMYHEYDKQECRKFLNRFQNWTDPTWGFYVYGTYTRPQLERDVGGESKKDKVQDKAAGKS
jgi:hypothetical protein